MKTITKEYKVYTFDELSQEAKDKARNTYNRNNEHTFLTDNLREYTYEELEARKIKVLGLSTSSNPSILPYYSLSNSQGDGYMFEATLEDEKGDIYTIKHNGHYYHERSTRIWGEDKDGREIDTTKFEETIYIPICISIRDRGYNEIEYEESEEYFSETCEANEYTFLEDGTIFNS